MIFLLAALLTGTVGYLLSIKKLTFFLKGYHFMSEEKKKLYNKELLLKYTGRLYYMISIMFLTMGIIYMTTDLSINQVAYTGDVIIVLTAVVGILLVMNKSKKNDS